MFDNRLFSACFAVWFAFMQAFWGAAPALAQQTGSGIDVDPPLIEHEIIGEVECNIRQTFVATVVDDDELDSVRLFYRFDGELTYSTVLMSRVSFSSSYIAQINTDPNVETTIEYYIQAKDNSGNRTVRGYAFNPLERTVILSDDALATNTTTAATEAAPLEAGKKNKVLYVVLGVLAVGLLAGLAGGSGGGSGGCDDPGCRIDINVDMPVVTE